jgi:hypothetical protein
MDNFYGRFVRKEEVNRLQTSTSTVGFIAVVKAEFIRLTSATYTTLINGVKNNDSV